MRDTPFIEHEIDTARVDLEHSLVALRDVIAAKLDIRQRIYDAIGRRGARSLVNPALLVGALLGGALLAMVGLSWWRARRA